MARILSIFAIAFCDQLHAATYNATIGVMILMTIQYFGIPPNFPPMATSIMLAIHHVNTRDGSVVGDTARSLPDGFRLIYKIADTHLSIAGGVKAILDWRSREVYAGFDSSCQTSLSTSSQNNNATYGLYATDSAKDRILSIVGADLSEVSAAVAVIAGMGKTPITSYFSVSTTLSDKSKYSLFSRTVPVQSINMLGLASIMYAFGWRKCAVLYSDSEYGNSFAAAEFRQRSSNIGISIVLYQNFKTKTSFPCAQGVAALNQSGACVFVFLAQGNVKMQGAILGSNTSGIGGRDGYAWIADGLGSNSAESLLASLSSKPEQLRPLLFGWLFLNLDALRGDRRAAFETAFSNADRRAVYDPLIPMPPSAFAPPRNVYDAFAYDAVWATALGIVAWTTNKSADIVSGDRSARFVGASGQVSFDNATGDRAAAGLTIQLINIRASDPNITDWYAVRLVQSSVGVWEQAQGGIDLPILRFPLPPY